MKKLTLFLVFALCASGAFAQMRVFPDGRVGFGRHLSANRGFYFGDISNLSNPTPFAIVRGSADAIMFVRTDGRISYGDGLWMNRFGTSFALGSEMFDFTDNTHTLGVATTQNQHGIGIRMQEVVSGRDGVRVVFHPFLSGSLRPFAAYRGTLDAHNVVFHVDQDGVVFSRGVALTSDRQVKANIEPISSPLERLMQVQGVRFDFDFPETQNLSTNARICTDSIFEHTRQRTPELTREIFDQMQSEQSRQRLGLIAQEVEKVFPELVRTQEDGLKSVFYSEMIPVLIEAIREQQMQIQHLQRQLDDIHNPGILRPFSTEAFDELITSTADETRNAVLHQNVPNPFSQSTQIGFYLPESVRSASLIIFDMQGKQLMQIQLTQRGEGVEFIQGSQLAPGIYLYALIADGREVDVKRMILTQ